MSNRVYDLPTARQRILDRCFCTQGEKIPLEKASGRILAADVLSGPDALLADWQEERIEEGTVIARRGTRIDPELHGILAALGMHTVEVYRPLLAGIISRGNELVDPGEIRGEGQVYNTSRYMLGTALKNADILSMYLGHVEDDAEKIAELLKTAVSMYDVVIMTGGTSAESCGFTKEALERAGAEILVERIAMKPGSFCCLSFLEGVPVFGLSGSPRAAMTAFHLVVMPAIRKLSGIREYLPEKIMVELDSDFARNSPDMRVLRGKLMLRDGTVKMRLDPGPAEGGRGGLSGANVFAIVQAGRGPLKKGSLLDAYLV